MQSIGKRRGVWNTKLHVVSADDTIVVALKLCSGREHDSPNGKDKVATGIKMRCHCLWIRHMKMMK
jgi:hypothetical protein